MAVEDINYELLSIVIKNIASDSSALNHKNIQVLKNILDKIIPEGGLTPPPDTAYASNEEAKAALVLGRFYKSTVTINGSPQILYTV
jgi:hypothetical protein